MIRALSGRPGNGKSRMGVERIGEELLHGNRRILTNMPVHVDRLNEFLQERWPDKTVNLHQRLQLLTDEEAAKFYLHRGWGLSLKERTKDEAARSGIAVDFKPLDDPANRWPLLYVIDEAHCFFNARRWMTNGLAVGYYLSQHRHLGDEILLITQHVEKLDKQLRLDIGEFCFCKNAKNTARRIRMVGPQFSAQFFDTLPGPGEVAVRTTFFRLDVEGWASCYSTGGGVGLSATLDADKGARIRSHSAWWWIAWVGGLVAAVVLVVAGVLWALEAGFGAYFKKAVPSAPVVAPAVPGPVVTGGALRQTARSLPNTNRENTKQELPRKAEVLSWTLTPRPTVWLSDGRVLEEGDGELLALSPQGATVLIEGRKELLKVAKRKTGYDGVTPGKGERGGN